MLGTIKLDTPDDIKTPLKPEHLSNDILYVMSSPGGFFRMNAQDLISKINAFLDGPKL